MLQQSARGQRADSGDFQQFSLAVANLPALAVKRDRKPVRLIADELHQVQHRRMAVEHHRIALLAVHVDNLLALGNRG